MTNGVPHKFYTSKAFEFCVINSNFSKQAFLDYLTSREIEKIYDDSSQDPDSTLAYKLKLHVSKLNFPLDFKAALYSIFNFLDNLVNLNPFDQQFKQQILDTLFTDSIQPTTLNEDELAKFNLESFTMYNSYLKNKLANLNSSIKCKIIVVSEFFDNMCSNPCLYQPHEYQFATRILNFYEDRSIALNILYDFFKLIRPEKFDEVLVRTKQTTKILNKNYYLPKNNFYNWMKDNGDDPNKEISDDFTPNTLLIPLSSESVFLNIRLELCTTKPTQSEDQQLCDKQTYYVMQKPINYPLGYSYKSLEEQSDFIYATCLGILYRGHFYINPKAIELKS